MQIASLVLEIFTILENYPKITGYRFVDVEILSEVIESLCCAECNSEGLKVQENFFECKRDFEKQFYTLFHVASCCIILVFSQNVVF